MRNVKLAALEGTAFCAFACALWLGAPSRAEAGPLCPAYVVQTGVGGFSSGTGKLVFTGFGANPVNGACTNFGAAGAQDPAAFSGAALASQALSELSQSTSQETARSAENSIANRRDQEEQRCAEGFSRVNGACERNAAAAAEEPPPPAAEPEPAPEPVHKKGKKVKAAGKHPKEAPAPRVAAKPIAPVTYAARRPMVVKGYEPPPPIEPPFRYGVWGQVFGDYEKRTANSAASVSSPDFAFADGAAFGGAAVPLDISVQSKTGTAGFQAGIDITSRGMILSNDGLIAGFLVGYIHSNVTVNTTSTSALPAVVSNGSTRLTANLSGPTLGTYATYFTGPFSADFLAKFDLLSLNQDFDETFGFGGPAGPFNFGFSGSGATSLVNSTIAANLNYRFNLYPNFWVEPTVGAQFTALSYGGGAAQLGLEDGQQVMVQGGARFGTSSVLSNGVLLTSTLTGLAYDDVLVHGGFIPGAAFEGNNILADADRGKVRGKGILAFALDFGQGVTSFVQGDVYGGQGLIGAGGKAGIRYQW